MNGDKLKFLKLWDSEISDIERFQELFLFQ